MTFLSPETTFNPDTASGVAPGAARITLDAPTPTVEIGVTLIS